MARAVDDMSTSGTTDPDNELWRRLYRDHVCGSTPAASGENSCTESDDSGCDFHDFVCYFAGGALPILAHRCCENCKNNSVRLPSISNAQGMHIYAIKTEKVSIFLKDLGLLFITDIAGEGPTVIFSMSTRP
jgi:hypothetical protein